MGSTCYEATLSTILSFILHLSPNPALHCGTQPCPRECCTRHPLFTVLDLVATSSNRSAGPRHILARRAIYRDVCIAITTPASDREHTRKAKARGGSRWLCLECAPIARVCGSSSRSRNMPDNVPVPPASALFRALSSMLSESVATRICGGVEAWTSQHRPCMCTSSNARWCLGQRS